MQRESHSTSHENEPLNNVACWGLCFSSALPSCHFSVSGPTYFRALASPPCSLSLRCCAHFPAEAVKLGSPCQLLLALLGLCSRSSTPETRQLNSQLCCTGVWREAWPSPFLFFNLCLGELDLVFPFCRALNVEGLSIVISALLSCRLQEVWFFSIEISDVQRDYCEVWCETLKFLFLQSTLWVILPQTVLITPTW